VCAHPALTAVADGKGVCALHVQAWRLSCHVAVSWLGSCCARASPSAIRSSARPCCGCRYASQRLHPLRIAPDCALAKDRPSGTCRYPCGSDSLPTPLQQPGAALSSHAVRGTTARVVGRPATLLQMGAIEYVGSRLPANPDKYVVCVCVCVRARALRWQDDGLRVLQAPSRWTPRLVLILPLKLQGGVRVRIGAYLPQLLQRMARARSVFNKFFFSQSLFLEYQ